MYIKKKSTLEGKYISCLLNACPRIPYKSSIESCILQEYFGFDFMRNTTVDFTGIGQYSTELFRQEANTIIQKHNTSEVRLDLHVHARNVNNLCKFFCWVYFD